MGKKRGFLHDKRKVLALYVKGGEGKKRLIFDSIQACALYFNEMGHQIKSTQIVRLLDGDGVWGYRETVMRDGVPVEREVQLIFDELYDGKTKEGSG